MDRRSTVEITAILVAAGAGVAAWPWLPTEMAVHFSATGTPDTVVPRTVGIAVIPVTTLVTVVVLEAAFRVDPPDRERTATVVTAATFGLMLALQLLVLGWNLGYAVPFEYVFVGTLVCLLVYAFVVEHRGG